MFGSFSPYLVGPDLVFQMFLHDTQITNHKCFEDPKTVPYLKHDGLVIPDPWLSPESAYNTSKTASGELVDYLLGGTALKYVGHRACICNSSLSGRRERNYVESAEMAR